MRDNRRWIFAGVGFVLVLVYYFAAWNAVGRDPRRGIVIPLFHPPQGISPALANYIHNWGFAREKWRAFTAAALSLAVRGLITFDQRDGKLILKAKQGAAEGGAPLPPGEGAILSWVKGQGLQCGHRQRPWQRRRQSRDRIHHQHRGGKPRPLLPPQSRLCRRRRRS